MSQSSLFDEDARAAMKFFDDRTPSQADSEGSLSESVNFFQRVTRSQVQNEPNESEDTVMTLSNEKDVPQTQQKKSGGRNYAINKDRHKNGGGTRSTRNSQKAPTNDFYDQQIVQTFEEKKASGVLTWAGVRGDDLIDTLRLEFGLWQECRQMLKIPPFAYIDPTLWGNRAGNINFMKRTTYGKPNPNYISPQMLSKSGDRLRRTIDEAFSNLPTCANGNRYAIFLIVSEVKVVQLKQEVVLHCQVLIAAQNATQLTYFVYEPLVRTNPYKPVQWLAKLSGMTSYTHFHVIFGTQKRSSDCFHHAIDFISRFVNNPMILEESRDVYPIKKDFDILRELLPKEQFVSSDQN